MKNYILNILWKVFPKAMNELTYSGIAYLDVAFTSIILVSLILVVAKVIVLTF